MEDRTPSFFLFVCADTASHVTPAPGGVRSDIKPVTTITWFVWDLNPRPSGSRQTDRASSAAGPESYKEADYAISVFRTYCSVFVT